MAPVQYTLRQVTIFSPRSRIRCVNSLLWTVPCNLSLEPASRLPTETIMHILSHCDMASLATLYRDKGWRAAVCKELSLALQHTLSMITLDPADFQSMLRSTRSIISGSTALYHVLRFPPTWRPSDVDIIVPNHRYAEVIRFILAMPGATIINEYPQEYESARNITGFSHIVQVQTPRAKFDIIQSADRSPFYPLVFYYGTHVMNAITADLAICSYPSLTLEGHAVLNPSRPRNDNSTRLAIEKYIQRGFIFNNMDMPFTHFGQSCSTVITCPNRNRAFGDMYCLVTPNSDRPIRETLDLMDEHSTTSWRLPGAACGNELCYVPGQLSTGSTTWGHVRRLAYIH